MKLSEQLSGIRRQLGKHWVVSLFGLFYAAYEIIAFLRDGVGIVSWAWDNRDWLLGYASAFSESRFSHLFVAFIVVAILLVMASRGARKDVRHAEEITASKIKAENDDAKRATDLKSLLERHILSFDHAAKYQLDLQIYRMSKKQTAHIDEINSIVDTRLSTYDKKLAALFAMRVASMTVPHFQKKLEDLDDYEKKVIAQFSKWVPGAWKTVSKIDRGEFLYPYSSWFQHANGEFSDAEFILMKGDGPIEPTGSEIESAKPPYVDKIELDSLQLEYKKWYARLTKIRSLLRSEIQALQHDALRARGIFVPIEWGTL